MQNKILNKYLMQYYIGGALFLFIGTATPVILSKQAKLQESKIQNIEYDSTDLNQIIGLLLIAACIYMTLKSAAFIKNTKYQSNKLTKLFLINLFAKHPELRQYDYILQNERKVAEIATFACNYLSESEQKQILDIMKRHSFETKNITKDAEQDIYDIIKIHAWSYPEYTQQILSLIKNKTYVMNPNEKIR